MFFNSMKSCSELERKYTLYVVDNIQIIILYIRLKINNLIQGVGSKRQHKPSHSRLVPKISVKIDPLL